MKIMKMFLGSIQFVSVIQSVQYLSLNKSLQHEGLKESHEISTNTFTHFADEARIFYILFYLSRRVFSVQYSAQGFIY